MNFFRVWGSGFRLRLNFLEGLEFRVLGGGGGGAGRLGFRFRVQGFRLPFSVPYRVSGFGFL